MRKHITMVATILAVLAFLPGQPAHAQAAQAAQQDQAKPAYTMAEYNAFQAANSEKDPLTKIKLLDDFISRYPNSTLMSFVGQVYAQACGQLNQAKNYPQAIACADKVVAMGDKVGDANRLGALQVRVQAFSASYSGTPPDANDQLTKERDAALLGAKLLANLAKPKEDTEPDGAFSDKKKPGLAFFYVSAASADLQLKDNAAAVDAFKLALTNNPKDAISYYRLGLAYFALTPPQPLDGFWALARAVDGQVQDTAKVKDYLRQRILAYEQPGCDTQVDAQLDELLQLAANTPDRPSSWSIPATADLQKIAGASNIATVLTDLSGGGDKAKLTWLAICGAEFPEVGAKVIDVVPGTDAVVLHVFTSSNQDEIQAATMPNMEVKVVEQPEAAKLEKDDPVRFSGTLSGFDPAPAFMLHWDKAKVNPEDLPSDKPAAKKPGARKPAAAKPPGM
jgi:hypothetical protein